MSNEEEWKPDTVPRSDFDVRWFFSVGILVAAVFVVGFLSGLAFSW